MNKIIKRNNVFVNAATVRKAPDEVQRHTLSEFGAYVAECLPKYIQKVQIVTGNELEFLIAPEGKKKH